MLTYVGVLTEGNPNAMEMGRPVFIDGKPLSDIVKAWLEELGLDSDFCFEESLGDCQNPLLGASIKLTVEIINEPQ